jgi:PAS domain S-box-containing protein
MLRSVLSLFSRVRVGQRLLAGFVLVAAASAVVGYRGLDALAQIRALQANASDNLLPSAINLDSARAGSLRIQRGERTLLLAARRKDEAVMRVGREHMAGGWRDIDEPLAAYAALPSEGKELALTKAVQADVAAFRTQHEDILKAIDQGRYDEAEAMLSRELVLADKLTAGFRGLLEVQRETGKAESDRAAALYAATQTTTWVVVGGAIAVGVALGLLLTASVTGPLNRVVAVLEGVAKGDLSRRAEVDARDELGRLAGALNTAIGNTQVANDRNLDFVRQLEAVSRAQAVVELKPDGMVVSANDNFLTVMSYAAAEVVGRHHSTFVPPAEAGSPAYRDLWTKLNRGEYQVGEFRRVAKGGREVWVSGGYFPIADAAGKIQKVVQFASDVTEAKRLEREGKENADRQVREAAELRRKVDAIQVTVGALAAGDFTQSVPDLGTDAVGQMASSLNQAVVAVRTALEGVREVSAQLADASGQLAAASEEIAGGAQEQASSLEETASTLEEITATVRQNSDAAQQARQLASGSKDVAEKGGQVVGSAVDAMGEINQSSKKIADIITTIDEIAFQTNLLALNAAVEAARAGEQGRGFAVVAAEVRNLAQRSATAAKEIKGLIQDSVKKVEAGTELVNRSGSTLDEIVTSVKRVTDIVTEIAAASREQSTGIDQVNKAVTQMDSVTQRNASQTEEMSATAQTLTEQAGQLRELVARFKLSEAARHTPRPAAVPARAAKSAPKSRAVAARSAKGGHDGSHELGARGGDSGFTEF